VGGARGGTQAETRQTERGLCGEEAKSTRLLAALLAPASRPRTSAASQLLGWLGWAVKRRLSRPSPGQSSFFALLLFCSPWLLPLPALHAPEHTGCIAVVGTAGWGWASASCTWGPCRAGLERCAAFTPTGQHADQSRQLPPCCHIQLHLAATADRAACCSVGLARVVGCCVSALQNDDLCSASRDASRFQGQPLLPQ
jgi:hypothetical protein